MCGIACNVVEPRSVHEFASLMSPFHVMFESSGGICRAMLEALEGDPAEEF